MLTCCMQCYFNPQTPGCIHCCQLSRCRCGGKSPAGARCLAGSLPCGPETCSTSSPWCWDLPAHHQLMLWLSLALLHHTQPQHLKLCIIDKAAVIACSLKVAPLKACTLKDHWPQGAQPSLLGPSQRGQRHQGRGTPPLVWHYSGHSSPLSLS